jgi:hypothetical protein
MCAIGVVATAESSCKGGLIRGCSAELSAAQSRAHELALASHHRLRFTRAVRVWGGGEANLAAGEAAGRCVRPTGERFCRIRWLGGHSRR